MKNLRRNLLWIAIVALLVASSTPISVVKASPTAVYVYPQEVRGILPTDPDPNFTITINVTGITNLNTWEINLFYNTEILDCTGVTEGSFLATGGTTIFIPQIFDETGRVYVVCMLEDVEATAEGDGDLVYIDFLVTGYGTSDLNIGEWNSPDLEAHNYLFNPTPAYIEHESVSGYFSNKIRGDVNGDRTVNATDLSDFNEAYGSESGDSNWNPNCDFNRDIKVDAFDLFDLGKNYGETI